MKYDPHKHHRRSIRWRGYDYAQNGGYFVTICAARRRHVFGIIENGVVRLNVYGRIVVKEWKRTAELRAEVEVDEFVVMPNHFHAIVMLVGNETNQGVPPHAPTDRRDLRRQIPKYRTTNSNAQNDETQISHPKLIPPSHNLGALVNGFKSAVTREINHHRAARGLSRVTVWQRNYYDRVIRDETELNQTRRYIMENPLNWAYDEYHPAPIPKPQA